MCASLLLGCLVCLLTQAASAADDNLLLPPQDSPLYRLSNFRLEQDATGNRIMAFDFQRTRKGKGSVGVRGRSKRGFVSIAAFISNSTDSGTMRMKSFLPSRNNAPIDLEVFLAQSIRFGGKSYYSVVSNAVRLGNPGPTIRPRAWTPEDIKAYQEHLRVMADDSAPKPPKSYPVSIDPLDDSQILPANAKVVRDTPLQACYQKKWHPLTALSQNEDGTVNVRWDAYGATYDCSMKRDELAIKKALLEKGPGGKLVTLAKSDAKKKGLITDPPKPRKEYPVSIEVPRDSEFVPKDVTLEPKTPLQACYAGKWNPITFLSHNADGTLNVRWDDYGPVFDCSMVRDQLIVRKSVVKKLQAKSPGKPPAKPASSPPAVRTWTDTTGAFKLRAKLVRTSGGNVTLLTDEGREVTVPISKFCKADQEYLKTVKAR